MDRSCAWKEEVGREGGVGLVVGTVTEKGGRTVESEERHLKGLEGFREKGSSQ